MDNSHSPDLPSVILEKIAHELNVRPQQVKAAVELLDGGATVPFVARYRKEVTGGLDDSQLRTLDERLRYLRELEQRRASVLEEIAAQGKLDAALESAIRAADTKQRLEDLYLPYRKKRRTKAQIAREAGLEPLADALLSDPTLDPATTALPYVEASQALVGENGDSLALADTKAALDGAKQILMERFAEDAELLERLRERLWSEGDIHATVVKGQEQQGAKFSDYFDHREPLAKAPSHRALAMFRGRNEGVLAVAIKLPDEEEAVRHPAEAEIARRVQIQDEGRPADKWLAEVVRWTWRVKLYTSLESELFMRLRERAEQGAIDVFADNLKDLLLAAPAGPRPTLGLDPGLRTGTKVAVVDATGKLVDTTTIYPHAPHNRWDESLTVLAALCQKHGVELIAIGNGTASRETDRLAQALQRQLPPVNGRAVTKVVVSEAGASVYSASEFAAREFPELDVTLRGAVSIARRLQDPLAELVKIEPKSIGVGQYQHDVSQLQLARALDAVVEDCVNAVGVELNMASPALLARVSGLNATLAENIVARRDAAGAFSSREALKEVSRLGPKTFEQCAGFLRISNGDNPLDASAVHPEAYPVVERIATSAGREQGSLIGDSAFLRKLEPQQFVDERFGLPTVTDILKELDKPGRDPRPEFKAAEFKEGVEKITDLRPEMILEGVITNVTHFGAFVDIGVHQDGLVHISALSERFVKDPREVVKAGDVVKVKVMEVDVPRNRIGLSMRLSDSAAAPQETGTASREPRATRQRRGSVAEPAAPMGALGEALLKAKAKGRR
ncbi:Tex family protein [Carnimonas nigrificans]|uniref:Tex family protein n=1 Tax=Carnimonas nigrificans TaxID=64323 RepID=UPI0004727EE3|nr:Tex family protein [Carnimonas nigrificans]